MKKLILAFSIALGSLCLTALPTYAQTVMVGGEAMYPKKDIIDNAVNSKQHTTLVAAVKAAGLVETLKGKGPFTVFAPVNDAFENLPEGTVSALLMPENKAMLTKVLTYHVVAGAWTKKDIAAAIDKGKGKAELKTVSGGTLWAKWNGPSNITLTDEKGNTANISTYDVTQSNGVIHVIDTVLMPK
ncbi:MAG: fasciclin domain-containing protein [Bacteroidota bacterium]